MAEDVNARLPALIREVRMSGFRVSNLFHRADGFCQANLRSNKAPLDFAWAYGPTFTDALEAALTKARKGMVAPMHPVGDDARDARQIGGVKEATFPIHPGELLPGQEGTVATDPIFDNYVRPADAKKGPKAAAVAPVDMLDRNDDADHDDDMLGAPAADVDDDDDLLGA